MIDQNINSRFITLLDMDLEKLNLHLDGLTEIEIEQLLLNDKGLNLLREMKLFLDNYAHVIQGVN